MQGDLGTLNVDGQQVGGFFDWEITVNLADTSTSAWTKYIVQNWKATAKAFWMLKVPKTDVMDAFFFFFEAGQLLQASANKVKVRLPSGYALDERMDTPIVMERVD